MPKKRRHIDSPSWSRYIPASELRVDPKTGRSVGPNGKATGVLVLPELTVTPRKVSASLGTMPSQYDMIHADDKYHNGYTLNTGDFLNAITLGGLNNLSPTQWARRLYDVMPLVKGRLSAKDYIDRWTFGNNGLVSANFAKENPISSAALNIGGDIIAGGSILGRNTEIGRQVLKNKGFAVVSKNGDKITWIPTNKIPYKGLSTIDTYYNPRYNTNEIGFISSKYRGEGRKLYDAAIKARGSIVSGRYYMSAPKSYRTMEHYYPNRKIIGNKGFWTNTNIKGIEDYISSGIAIPKANDIREFMHFHNYGSPVDLVNAPVYELTEPYSDIASIRIPSISNGYKKAVSWIKDRIKGKRKTYRAGGTIHIKPENRGKFNALKKRTGKTTEELTHSKNPLTRKRAIFAQNARKWNHKKK